MRLIAARPFMPGAILFLPIILTGCVSTLRSHPEYALYFSGDGLPIAPAATIRHGCIDMDHKPPAPQGWATISEDCFVNDYVPRILDGLMRSGKTKALLFVHGGLNSLSNATARVDRLTSVGDGSLTLRENYYPIFINWQASFTSSYKDHLFRIRQGLRQPFVARLTSPYIFVEDGLLGAVRITPDTIELLYNRRENVHQRPICFRSPGPEYGLKADPACSDSEPEVEIRWGSDRRTQGAKFESFLRELPWTPIKPFATGLVIDSFGSQAWKIMIRRTEQMFHSELAPVELGKQIDRRSLTYFLQQLNETLPRAKVTRLDFVAHSAGAIILNRALREVPGLPVRNVVYMAAASSEEDYEITMLGDGKHTGYLTQHPCARVYHLVLQPKAEINESYLGLFELAPRGSLLYWIGNFLAEPEFLRQRTAGRASNLAARLDATPQPLRSRVHLKVFDYGVPLRKPPSDGSQHDQLSWYSWCDQQKESCQPQAHGDFSEMPFWQQWFWTPNVAQQTEVAACRE